MISIREGKPEDADAIATIQIAGWRWAYFHILPQDFLDNLDVESRAAQWRERIASGQYREDKRLFVAGEGAVTGFAVAGPARYDDRMANGELWSLYVDPAQARSGTGKALFNAARDFLKAQSHDGLYVMCMRDNPIGHAFYRKMGGTLNPCDFTIEFGGIVVDDKSLYWRF